MRHAAPATGPFRTFSAAARLRVRTKTRSRRSTPISGDLRPDERLGNPQCSPIRFRFPRLSLARISPDLDAGRAGRIFVLTLATAALLVASLLPSPAGAAPAGFTTRAGRRFVRDGAPVSLSGVNAYYLHHSPPSAAAALFSDAAAAGLGTVRVWGFLDVGTADGAGSVDGPKSGVYFRYMNGGAPAVREGPDGLGRLDALVAAAGAKGVKLVIVLTNNWKDYGGVDQYVAWRGAKGHGAFFTDAVIRGWFKEWVKAVVTRKNSVTGKVYRDDPTVAAWELINEPRCKGSTPDPAGAAPCDAAAVTAWASDVAAYVKSLDPHHLVGIGDEGFFCRKGAADWTENCSEGADAEAFARIPSVDYVGAHLYPASWGKTEAWGRGWIGAHAALAAAVDKPFVLGEFGAKRGATPSHRPAVFSEWTSEVTRAGGAGALAWMLASDRGDGTKYPDYDGYTFYGADPETSSLARAARASAAAEVVLHDFERPDAPSGRTDGWRASGGRGRLGTTGRGTGRALAADVTTESGRVDLWRDGHYDLVRGVRVAAAVRCERGCGAGRTSARLFFRADGGETRWGPPTALLPGRTVTVSAATAGLPAAKLAVRLGVRVSGPRGRYVVSVDDVRVTPAAPRASRTTRDGRSS